MINTKKASAIVKLMFQNDVYSQWLGIKIIAVNSGTCTLKMQINNNMLNGFGIAHGGISYAFADSALAFASNSHGQKAVSIETAISHLQAIKLGDILTAQAIEKSKQHRIAVYEIKVTNQIDELVALFKGTVYRKREEWVIE